MAAPRLSVLLTLAALFTMGLSNMGRPALTSPFQMEQFRQKRELENVTCGVRNLKENQAIPESTFLGEFPWMIDVRKKDGNSSRVRCGGSLIRPNVVLTAAHCVSTLRAEELMVRAGQWDRSELSKEVYQEREVDKIVSHENYNTPPMANDLALLFLRQPFVINKIINLICLPETKVEMDTDKCLATGWGRNHLTKDLQNSKLRKVDLPIVDRKECEEKLKNYTERRKNFEFHDSFICAGGQPLKDTCTGDGGGPLVCPMKGTGQPGRYSQLGIVSWGVGCGNVLPAVYTSVPYFSSWISEKLSS